MNAWAADLLSNSMAQRVAWALIHFLWQGAAVALLLAATLQLVRGRSAQVRWVLCCGALGLMAVLPVVTACVVSVDAPVPVVAGPVVQVLPGPEAVTLPPAGRAAGLAPAAAGEEPASPVAAPGRVPDGAAEAAPAAPWGVRLERFVRPALPWSFAAWLVGMVVMSVWHLGGWFLLGRTKRHGVRFADGAIRDVFDRLLRRLSVSRPVRLLQSARVAVPTVAGWLRPVVLLPASALSGLSIEQIEAILAHELAHVRRYDCLVRLIQAVVETLLFYHPAVWWVSGRIRQESEHCCDDAAVAVCGSRVTYARALAGMEGFRAAPAAAAAASGGRLLDRIRRIVGLRAGRAGGDIRRWGAAAAAVFVLAGLTVAAIFYGCQAPTATLESHKPVELDKRRAWIGPGYEKDDLPPGLLIGGFFRGSDTPPEVRYRLTRNSPQWKNPFLFLELLGRLPGVFRSNDRFEVLRYYRRGNRLVLTYRRGKPDPGKVNAPRSVYLYAPLPDDLKPGKYAVEVVGADPKQKLPRLDYSFRVPPGVPGKSASLSLSWDDVLLKAIAAKLPKNWTMRPMERGQVKPLHWPKGEGVHISAERKGFVPADWKRIVGGEVIGGRVHVWIMGKGYSATGPQDGEATAPPATEIERRHGRRVLIWGGGADWKGWREDIQAALKTMPPPAARRAGKDIAWGKADSGLRARINASRYLSKRLGLQVGVRFENVSKANLAIDFGELQALSWKITDAAGKEVEPAKVRRAEPVPVWHSMISGQGIGRILGKAVHNRDGRLKIGFYEWKLKPGRYSIHCLLSLQSDAVGKRSGQTAWRGKIELPPAEFEVIGEVSDKDLIEAGKQVRAAHRAGGLAMWRALAKLVRPGMTVRQMYLVLPPRESPFKAGVLYYPRTTLWNGQSFFLTYSLDDAFGVEASGVGRTSGGPTTRPAVPYGENMVLTSTPRIKSLRRPSTAPATQPAAGAGRRKARITRHVDGDMWAYFSGKDVSGRDVRELRTIPGLRRLSVHGCRIDADVMDAIAGLDGLTYLALECTRGLDDEGLRKIGRLVRLRHLRLEYTGITDKGMPALAGLRQLTSLNLRGTRVTDEGLVHVAGLTRLKSLTLYLSDVGGPGLRHLKPLTALRELRVGPFMPAQYMAELRKSLPKVRITSSPGVRYISPGVPKRRPTTRLTGALSPGRQAVEAIEVNDAAWLKSLLAAALDANVHEGNLYLLRHAIDNRRVACVKVLLAAGADIERSGGDSPLTRVCGGIGRYADVPLQFDLDIIHALIGAGADVNSRDDGGPPLVALVGGARTTRPTGRASGPLLRGAPAMAALLAAGADPNLPNKDGKPALYYACKRGLVQTAQQLIARGAKVNFKAPYSHDGRFEGLTPLQAAASGGHNAVVKLLIARGAKVDPIDGGHRTPLWHAAAAGWGDTVDLLMAHGADINVVVGGRTPLGLATGWGVQVAELLISKGANLNPRGPGVWTPLQLAAWHDRPKMVKFLLARGAKLDVFSACCLGRLAAVKKFLASGPSLIRARTGKTTALDFARRRQRTEIGKLLVARGAKVDLLSAAWLGLVDKVAAFLDAEGKALDSLKHRETMTQAAVGGRNKVIELLLARGFKLREHPESLVYAARHGHRATVELLLAKGADVNAREVAGALHEAATNGDIEMAKLLLARGANVDIEEDREDCDTPLFCAIAAGQTEMAKLLIASGARATADGDFIAARQYDNKASLRCLFELFVAHRKTHGGPQRALDDALAGVALSHMPEYVETLLKMGANANALGNRRRPLLWYADEHTARALLAHGAKVDFRSACALGRIGRVKAMLAANPKLGNAAEPPPIDIAASHGRAAIVKLLLARGAKPSSLSLYWAVAGNHKEVVALLLDADVDLGDPQSLWFAVRRGTSKEIMRLIQAHRAKHRPAPATKPAVGKAERAQIAKAVAEGFGQVVREHARAAKQLGALKPGVPVPYKHSMAFKSWGLSAWLRAPSLNRSATMEDLTAKCLAAREKGLASRARAYVEAASKYLTHKDAAYRTVACEFLVWFPQYAVESDLTPAVGALLTDRAAAFEGVFFTVGQRDIFITRIGGGVRVSDLARRALARMTTFHFDNLEAFRSWWGRNKEYRRRLWYWSLRWRHVRPGHEQAALADLDDFRPSEALRMLLLAGNDGAKLADSGLPRAAGLFSSHPWPVRERCLNHPQFSPKTIADFIRKHELKGVVIRIVRQDPPWVRARGASATGGLLYAIMPVLPLVLDKSDAALVAAEVKDARGLLERNQDILVDLVKVAIRLDPKRAEGILVAQLKRKPHQPSIAAELIRWTGLKHWQMIQAACPERRDKLDVIGALAGLRTPQATALLGQWLAAEDWRTKLDDDGYETNDGFPAFLFDEFVKAAAALNGGKGVIAQELLERTRWQGRKGWTREQTRAANKPVPAARAEAIVRLKKFFARAAAQGGAKTQPAATQPAGR